MNLVGPPVVLHVLFVTRVFGLVALVALAVAVVALAYLHAAPTGLSPRRNAVSQYGITSYRAGYRVQTMALGASAAAMAVALATSFHTRAMAALVVLLLVFAVARLIISWSPMDQPGSTSTASGRRHGLIAAVTFLSITLAAAHGANAMTAATWARVATVSTGLAWAMGLTLLAMVLGRFDERLRSVFGLIERLFYLEILALLGVVSVACVTLTR